MYFFPPDKITYKTSFKRYNVLALYSLAGPGKELKANTGDPHFALWTGYFSAIVGEGVTCHYEDDLVELLARRNLCKGYL